MKTFLLLILLLAGGFAFWKYSPTLSDRSSASNESKTNDGFTHKVVKGDTLTSISKKYNTTIASIKQLNKLSSDTIHLGERLSIDKNSKPTISSQPPVAKTASKPKSAPKKKPIPTAKPKTVAKKDLPKSTVMESSKIAIDIDARNQVYLKNSSGQFTPAGSIIYGSDADKDDMEVKTITFRDTKGRETTLPGAANPEEVIRLSLKKK